MTGVPANWFSYCLKILSMDALNICVVFLAFPKIVSALVYFAFLWHLSQYSYNYSNCINIVYCLPRLWEHILDSLIFGQRFVLLVICINKSYFLQKCFEELDPKKCFWLCLFVRSCQSFLFSAHLILRKILAFSEQCEY